MTSDPERILLRLPNWTGDLVMATPALRALRACFGSARLVAHVRAELAPLLDGHPGVDEILPVRSHHRGLAALLREGKALRARGFGLGICLPDSWSSALLMRAAGVERVVGYRRAGRGVLLDQPVEPRPEWGPRRLVARERSLLHLVEAIGCRAQETRLELHTTAAEEAEADALLAPLETSLRVVLAPGASYGAAKRWPAASFATLADRLARDGIGSVIVGTPDEAPLGREIARAARSAPLDRTGRIGLGGLKAVLRRADAVVCNDAGARHIATAFGTPAVVLFGPTALERTDCNLETTAVVAADVSCRPCGRRDCPIDHRCMTRIEPEAVAARVLAAL